MTKCPFVFRLYIILSSHLVRLWDSVASVYFFFFVSFLLPCIPPFLLSIFSPFLLPFFFLSLLFFLFSTHFGRSLSVCFRWDRKLFDIKDYDAILAEQFQKNMNKRRMPRRKYIRLSSFVLAGWARCPFCKCRTTRVRTIARHQYLKYFVLVSFAFFLCLFFLPWCFQWCLVHQVSQDENLYKKEEQQKRNKTEQRTNKQTWKGGVVSLTRFASC